MTQRWTFRCSPTDEQQQTLAKTFGCVRYVYNWALRLRTDAYREHQQSISYAETSRRLTLLKQQDDTSWLNDVSAVPLQQVLRDLQMAFVNFFGQRADYPQFKKKSRRQSAEYTKSGFRFNPATKTLVIAKIGRLHVKWSREVIPMPSSIRVIKTTTGKYFVSLVVEVAPVQWPTSKESVGIDFGVKTLMALSNGELIDNPRHQEREGHQLRVLQKRLSRTQKASRRRARARQRLAILHERTKHRRLDDLHKLTTTLVKRFDTIYLEDLHLKGLAQNHCVARVLSDAAIGIAMRLLQEKATRYGKTVVRIDRFFPSSKTCSTCGYVVDELPLSIRSWACPSCGTDHDRDLNAAKNILAAGQAATAHGAGVTASRRQRRPASRRRSANHSERLATVS